MVENDNENKNFIYKENEISYSGRSEESKSDSKKGRHQCHKKGYLLFPDKIYFQNRYKIISLTFSSFNDISKSIKNKKWLYEFRNKEKNKTKDKNKNLTQSINESNKKEFIKPITISIKKKSSFSLSLNTTERINKNSEADMKIRKVFKGIKSTTFYSFTFYHDI